jgi:hypothetical protein
VIPRLHVMRLPSALKRQPWVWIAASALLVASLTFFWPAPTRSAGGLGAMGMSRSSTPAGPVVITAVHTGFLWRVNELPPTSITVQNLFSSPATCKVWWILSTPGIVNPWDHPAMMSKPTTVRFEGDQAVSVKAETIEDLGAPAGYYSMSVWVHCLDRSSGAWFPSDGATVNGVVETLDPSTSVRHVRRASSLLWINSIAPGATLTAHRPTQFKVVIANSEPEPVLVQVWFYVARPGVEQPWKTAHSSRSQVVDVSVSGASLSSVEVPISELPDPGRYALSAWLHELAVSSSVPLDGAWFTHDVEVDPAG